MDRCAFVLVGNGGILPRQSSYHRNRIQHQKNMKTSLLNRLLGSAGVGLAAFACSVSAGESGTLYTADNASAGNHVLVITRSKGEMSVTATYGTSGLGLGTANGLGSQGSLLLSPDSHWLFVCNAGSGEISVFETLPGGDLQLTDKVPSGGGQPVSLALNGSLLYVLNVASGTNDDNITAFHFGCGNLTMLADSSRALSAANTTPTQVSFSRGGDALVVTEKISGMIDTWAVGRDGLATNHQVFASEGVWPFGFAVGRGDRIFVSEADAGAADASSVSSYNLKETGALSVISAKVATQQTAACWLVLTDNGSYAYTANAGSATISGFRVSPNGSLELLQKEGFPATTGMHPADMAFSHDGLELFSLNNGDGTVSAFGIKANGSLKPMSGLTGLPTTSAGLAAW
jgi:6-phosphogluconolactonase (cycloisomerase 2 family)